MLVKKYYLYVLFKFNLKFEYWYFNLEILRLIYLFKFNVLMFLKFVRLL